MHKHTLTLLTALALCLVLYKTSYAMPTFQNNNEASLYQPVFLDQLLGNNAALKKESDKEYLRITDEESLKKNTQVFKVTPFEDESLAFEVTLPKDWTKKELSIDVAPEISRHFLGNISHFTGPTLLETQPKLIVQALQLDHDILIEHWLEHHILTNGYSQEGEQINTVNSSSTSYVYVNISTPFFVHVRAFLHQNRVILVRFEVPLEYRDQFDFLQKKSVDSFKLLALNTHTGASQKRPFSMMDALHLKYPKTWSIENTDFSSTTRVTTELHNKGVVKGSLDGFVRITAIKRQKDSTLKKELMGLRTHLEEYHKVKINRLISSETAKVTDRFNFARKELYDISFSTKSALIDQQLWVVALADEKWYTLIYMLSPKKTQDFYTWAKNTRSFNLLIQSIQ